MTQERIPQSSQWVLYDPMQAFVSQLRVGQVPEQVKQLGRNVQAGYEKIGGTKAVAGKYMPALGGVMSLMADPTNVGGAAGNALGGMAGAALGSPLGPVGALAGSVIGSTVGGGIGTALQSGIVGAAKAATGIPQAVSSSQMARGESPGVIPGIGGKSIESLGMGDIERLMQIQRQNTEALMPTYNAMRNADMNRQMQLNQQLGQLTGGLNQQRYMAELAGGAQSQAGATTRTMLTAANPYAESVFQYRG